MDAVPEAKGDSIRSSAQESSIPPEQLPVILQSSSQPAVFEGMSADNPIIAFSPVSRRSLKEGQSSAFQRTIDSMPATKQNDPKAKKERRAKSKSKSEKSNTQGREQEAKPGRPNQQGKVVHSHSPKPRTRLQFSKLESTGEKPFFLKIRTHTNTITEERGFRKMPHKKQRAPSKGHALLEHLVQRLSQHKEGMPIKDKKALEKRTAIHSSIKAKPRKKPKKKRSIVKSEKARKIKSSKAILHAKSEKAKTQKPHKFKLPKGRTQETRVMDSRSDVRATNSKNNEKPVSAKAPPKKKTVHLSLTVNFAKKEKEKSAGNMFKKSCL
jgi:hypothetical protein